MNAVDVLAEVEEEILSSRLNYESWFCSITDDPEPRRFVGHLKVVIGTWKVWDMGDYLDARQMEVILCRKGCQRVLHPGGKEARFFYIFLPEAPGLQ